MKHVFWIDLYQFGILKMLHYRFIFFFNLAAILEICKVDSEDYLSFYTGLAHTRTLRQGVLFFELLIKNNNKNKTQQKKSQNFWLNFCLNKKCPKLLCGLGIAHSRRQTFPIWNSSGENEFFRASLYVWYIVSTMLSTILLPGSFQTVSRGHILVFFNRHCSIMNLVKKKQ